MSSKLKKIKKHDAEKPEQEQLVDTSELHPNGADNITDDHGLSEVDKQFNHRSNNSAIKGGQNEYRGEPTPPIVVGPGLHGDVKSRYH